MSARVSLPKDYQSKMELNLQRREIPFQLLLVAKLGELRIVAMYTRHDGQSKVTN